MAQLIATTDIKHIKLLCHSQNIENSYKQKYGLLKKYFKPEVYKLFAYPKFKANKKINWYTETQGIIYPFVKADEVLDNVIAFLENKIVNLYTLAINTVESYEDKEKIIEELDRLLTINSIDDIYIIVSGNNSRELCIINWCQNKKGDINPIAGIFNPKTLNVTVRVRRQNEPVSDYKIWVRINNKEEEYITDKNGQITIENLELLSKFTIIQKFEDKIIQEKTYIVEKQNFEFELLQGKTIDLQIKAVDDRGFPLSKVKLDIILNKKSIEVDTDANGFVGLGEVSLGTEITIMQKISESRTITKTYRLDQNTKMPLVFKGTRIAGSYLVIKVFDINSKPYVNADLEIIIGDRSIYKKTNKEGVVIITDLKTTDHIIIRHLVGNRPVAQKTVEYIKDLSEIIFRSHVPQTRLQDIKIILKKTEDKPITNLSLKLKGEDSWQFAITDIEGVANFEQVNCNDKLSVEFKYKGKEYTYPIDCKENIEKYEIVLAEKKGTKLSKTKLFYILVILLGLLILFASFFLLKNLNLTKENREEIQVDTVKQEVLFSKFIPYKARVYLLYAHNRFPLSQARVFLITDSLLRELSYDSGYFYIDIQENKPIDLIVYYAEADSLYTQLLPKNVDTILIRKKDLKIANDTVCGVRIYEQGTYHYLQTFRFSKKVDRVRYNFNKMFRSDIVRVYVGPKEKISPNKLVKEQRIFSDTARVIINLPYPDSLVTFEVIAGEPNLPAWVLRVLCK